LGEIGRSVAADARTMRSKTLVVLACLLASLLLAPTSIAKTSGASSWVRSSAATRPSAAHRASATSALEAQVLVEVNTLRRGKGLKPLRLSTRLSAAADVQSAAMARKGFFSHDSADGSAFWKRIQRFYGSSGYRFWSVGENLLWSSPDVDSGTALRMWMNSPEHRANLLNRSWREIGLSAVHASRAPGLFGGRDVTIVTADFGVRR
jgi:uncharacterized protein YkwD